MPIGPLGIRQLVLLRRLSDQRLQVLPLHAAPLNAEGRVRLAVVPASRALQGGSGREVSVGSGLVEPAEKPVAHLGHVRAVVVHLGSLVLQQELALLLRRPN